MPMLKVHRSSPSKRHAGPSCEGMKIEADFDDLNVLLDVQGTDGAADIVNERHPARSEAVIIIFQSDRPDIRERPFNARARGPAKSGLQPLEVISRKHVK